MVHQKAVELIFPEFINGTHMHTTIQYDRPLIDENLLCSNAVHANDPTFKAGNLYDNKPEELSPAIPYFCMGEGTTYPQVVRTQPKPKHQRTNITRRMKRQTFMWPSLFGLSTQAAVTQQFLSLSAP